MATTAWCEAFFTFLPKLDENIITYSGGLIWNPTAFNISHYDHMKFLYIESLEVHCF